ncbi:MAG: type II toxin-antitoxin system RelE/ParE family toxin [Acidobacteriota bacterium]|nr:MAG: type II toxin-antitoxin system RelE/ParE family toxin [Acidobacteriota bacterium]
MKTITITSIARSDIAGTAEFISRDAPTHALRFLDAVERSFAEIQSFPLIGREATFESEAQVRFWYVKDFPNYLIFYSVRSDEIRIVRVIHSSRDYQTSFTT